MSTVVLDASPALDGLDCSPLESVGNARIFASTAPGEVAARIGDARVLVVNKVKIGREQLAAAPNLKLITVLATGYDVIDLSAAKGAGVTVCNVRGYATDATAQTAIALLLELCQRVGHHAELVADGEWTRRKIWSFWDSPLVELAGKRAVIVGLGAIGTRVAHTLSALGMDVVAARLPGRESGNNDPFPRVALADALALADVVMLHCPLNDNTRGLIDGARLGTMKPTALLVNAARGAVVDEIAVADALNSGRLAGYATDVLSTEPPPENHPLIGAKNAIVTPHLAWATPETRARLLRETIENIRAFDSGAPRNVVGAA